MKIEWIDGEREVPGIGRLHSGDVREVPDVLGKGLIAQKQAVEAAAEKEKAEKRKEKSRPPGPARVPEVKGYNPVA